MHDGHRINTRSKMHHPSFLSRGVLLGAFTTHDKHVIRAYVSRRMMRRLVDAFALADPYFSLPGTVDEKHPDGRWKMSEAVHDCKAFTCLKVLFDAQTVFFSMEPY